MAKLALCTSHLWFALINCIEHLTIKSVGIHPISNAKQSKNKTLKSKCSDSFYLLDNLFRRNVPWEKNLQCWCVKKTEILLPGSNCVWNPLTTALPAQVLTGVQLPQKPSNTTTTKTEILECGKACTARGLLLQEFLYNITIISHDRGIVFRNVP